LIALIFAINKSNRALTRY